MVDVSVVSKICGSCQRSYYTWKKKNPDIEKVLSRIDMDENDVNDSENEVIFKSNI